MSLSTVVGNALSGLTASQAGLRTASNNVANVNTPGYARTVATLQSRNVNGSAMGVQVAGIDRIIDRYLQTASINAISDEGMARVQAAALDRLQAQFGGLDDPGSMFSRLSAAFSGISQASVDPTLSVSRLSAAADLQSFFDETERLSIAAQDQRQEADAQISSLVGRTNVILNEIFELNASVQTLSSTGGDTSGAANRQSELLDELAQYMDINTEYKSDGRVVVRTGDGVLLVDNYTSHLQYRPAGSGTYGITYGTILAQPPTSGAAQELDGHVLSGELRALFDLRDHTLPGVGEELAELTAAAADVLNGAHNNSTAYPASNTLTGRNTGLDVNDLHMFSGETTIAVTDPTGLLVKRIDIDFDAMTLSVDGGAPAGIGNTVGTLQTAIDTALGADGSASFSNGVLEISAANAANGIATVQSTTDPSSRGGRGFAHFFGLNDLVRSSRPGFFETGMNGSDPHLMSTGSSLEFRIMTAQGGIAANISVPVTTGETFNDIITDLNDPAGVGRYVTFALDGNGKLSMTPNAGYEQFGVKLVSDDTSRSSSSISFSNLFGVGLSANAGRSEIYNVDPAVRADGTRLALGQLDIDAGTVAGDVVISAGDSTGGQALQAAWTANRSFSAAGSLSQANSTLQDYSARLAGSVGSLAARAESNAESAAVLMETAQRKRTDVEGVNLDEELAAMTLFQQSYNASARMLQAARDMTDALMSIL